MSRIIKISALLAVLVGLLLCGCAENVPTEAPTEPPTQPATTVPPTVDDGITTEIFSTPSELSQDDLFAQSVLIVGGTVESGRTVKLVSPGGGERYCTDYALTVGRVYRGDASDTVTVRVQGSYDGTESATYEPNESLEVGKSYLLFLFQPNYGGSYYPDDDSYYILGTTQGVYEQTGEEYLSRSGALLTEGTLLKRADEFPLDPDYFRRTYHENLETNLRSGLLTQEEYDALIAADDVYAQVVEAE